METLIILKALAGGPDYQHHPVVTMWRGCEFTLSLYGLAMAQEWKARGESGDDARRILEFMEDALRVNKWSVAENLNVPWWLGDPTFHQSQQAHLIMRNPEHYGPLWPDVNVDLWRQLGEMWPEARPPIPRASEHDKWLLDTELEVTKL